MNRLPEHRRALHGRTFAQAWSAATFDPIAHYSPSGAWSRWLSILLAFACGVGAALALLHWLTPCEAAALCSAPLALPLRAWMPRNLGRGARQN